MECKGKVLADAASCSPGSLTGVQSHGQVSYGIDKKDWGKGASEKEQKITHKMY